MLGTLRLTTAFSRFGFIVPRGGGAEASVRVGQRHRSAIKAPQDGIVLTEEPAAVGNRGKGVKNVGIAK